MPVRLFALSHTSTDTQTQIENSNTFVIFFEIFFSISSKMHKLLMKRKSRTCDGLLHGLANAEKSIKLIHDKCNESKWNDFEFCRNYHFCFLLPLSLAVIDTHSITQSQYLTFWSSLSLSPSHTQLLMCNRCDLFFFLTVVSAIAFCVKCIKFASFFLYSNHCFAHPQWHISLSSRKWQNSVIHHRHVCDTHTQAASYSSRTPSAYRNSQWKIGKNDRKYVGNWWESM